MTGFNPLAPLGDDYIDTDTINDLIENDTYLLNRTPTIHLSSQAGRQYDNRNGNPVKITSGVIAVRKFTGSFTGKVPFNFPILDGPPVVLLTPYLGTTPGMAQIVKWLPGYKGFEYKITLVNSKATVSQPRLCWAAIYVVGA